MNNNIKRYSEPHPIEIEEGIFIIENYDGVQLFDKEFPSWEEAQGFIDCTNWASLQKELEADLRDAGIEIEEDSDDFIYDCWKDEGL